MAVNKGSPCLGAVLPKEEQGPAWSSISLDTDWQSSSPKSEQMLEAAAVQAKTATITDRGSYSNSRVEL